MLVAVRLGRDPAYRIAWSEPGVWLTTSPPAATAVALLRPVVLVLAGHLLLATASYAGALLAHAPRAVAGLAAVTPAGIRGVTERAVAAWLLTATWAAPAIAHATGADPLLPPGLHVAVATNERTAPGLSLPSGPPPDLAPPDAAMPEVAPPRAPDLPSPPGRPGRTVTVVSGDHLWGIAARALAAARATSPDALATHDLARYWADTVAANRATVRSGDPDLIHPGEVIRLPPPPPP